MKIGIYGGSFDPPHLGHVAAAQAAVRELSLDRLLVIPAGQPPHKKLSAGAPDASVRFKMAELAFSQVDCAVVSDIELRREGKSYTFDTLTQLSAELSGNEFVLLMGTDMAASFTSWYRAGDIAGLASLAAFAREDDDGEMLKKAAADLRAFCGAELTLVPLDPVEVSSTELRAKLPLGQGSGLLTPSVYELIVNKHLYGAEPSLSWLRTTAMDGMKPARKAHTHGCEETAAALARFWGADEKSLRKAAILHDITRGDEVPSQLQMCSAYGIMMDAEESGSRALLHAATGAAVAKNRFGMSDSICSMIRWHTTGREHMTLEEKLLYLADATEPTRSYPGVDELRRLTYENIDRAMIFALEHTIDYTQKQGITPHPRSKQALMQLRGNI